ncbi:MAG: hypothetical protein EOO31_01365 [Comamonadaceae bacterium]|nr:MAG: hypothetical protein EOO31_01365 [Comamonadaceae bacterium]
MPSAQSPARTVEHRPDLAADVSQGQVTDSATRIHYLHTDHLGNPVLGTNKHGATTWKAVAEAFGATGTLPESQVEMNLRFPGSKTPRSLASSAATPP